MSGGGSVSVTITTLSPFCTWTTWLMSIFAAKAILVISIGHLLSILDRRIDFLFFAVKHRLQNVSIFYNIRRRSGFRTARPGVNNVCAAFTPDRPRSFLPGSDRDDRAGVRKPPIAG